jgi:hypothetical protein
MRSLERVTALREAGMGSGVSVGFDIALTLERGVSVVVAALRAKPKGRDDSGFPWIRPRASVVNGLDIVLALGGGEGLVRVALRGLEEEESESESEQRAGKYGGNNEEQALSGVRFPSCWVMVVSCEGAGGRGEGLKHRFTCGGGGGGGRVVLDAGVG